jgi:hypothetical protein
MRSRPNDSAIGDSGGQTGPEPLARQTHAAVGASA